VVPHPGRAPSDEALRLHCREQLALYKVPARFTLVESLPRNAAGKLLRAELAARR
jgi:long-chain acyl-CoA synthetase